MEIPAFIRQIPTHLHTAFDLVIDVNVKVLEFGLKIFTEMRESTLWQQLGKPFYEHNIKPLDLTDGIVISSALIISYIFMKIAIWKLGVGGLPIAIGVPLLLVGSAIKLASYRTTQKFNEKAWDEVDEMRHKANDLSYTDQLFAPLTANQTALQKNEFDHLKQELEQLDKQLRDFKKIAQDNQTQDKLDALNDQIGTLKDNVKGNAHDEGLLDALEQEIESADPVNQHLTEIEKCVNDLSQLQTASAPTDIPELHKKVQEFVKAAQRFDDSKQVFMNFLVGLEQKLAYYKQITPLP